MKYMYLLYIIIIYTYASISINMLLKRVSKKVLNHVYKVGNKHISSTLT